MKSPLSFTLIFLFLSLISCRPVLTIGWTEILILAVIFLIILGPSFLRFYKRYRKFRKYEKKD
ncbi:MAG: twin-arginine translocase TatA/TatE family subunit [Anaerolineae bacterium]|nr:twin-arginine translocase TatA/TatE family subunit [Anaerolineae bacterium]